MFRNRNNSQKPPDDLLATFKASFPGVGPAARRNSASAGAGAGAAGAQSVASSTDVLDIARQHGDDHDIKDLDPTPRGNIDQWRFTPSLLDPNSFAFSSFANQLPGYYTPTPGGTNTLYHPQAGDLHTPGFTMGLGTPLSMPHSEGSLHASQVASGSMQDFNPQVLAPQVFQNPNPFAFHHHHQHNPHAHTDHQNFPHQHFNHDPVSFGSFQSHPHHDEQKMDDYTVDVDMHEHSPIAGFTQSQQSLDASLRQEQSLLPLENFRYHLTLNAPTAMIKHPEEIPVTYLNKGQAYAISIVDTNPTQLGGITPRYRTYVRISFEDEQQRLRPAQCWQLWKEGRGINEAHHRGGRLQAVEFVDPNQTGSLDHSNRPRIELESASFDCFAVTWSPVPNGPPECSVSVRFNFLSTDFSHSKGVKGIPVRLCAKTQLLSGNVPGSPIPNTAEICYCKVKLFRDHGAERKLSNDVTHVKKTIDKLKQQISQVESGMKDFGKRKRSGSGSKSSTASRPGKVLKHKRTWSMSSTSDTGMKGSQEEDLQAKLAALQDMFTSTRPASVLFLKGEDPDDPDLHPVQLTGEVPEFTKIDADPSMWEEKPSTNPSSIVSPSPSLHSEPQSASIFQKPVPFQPPSSNDWQNTSQTATTDLHAGGISHHYSPPDIPSKVQRLETGTLSGWIEALGVDSSYQPPPERVIKPVACFYIQPRVLGEPPKDDYYRAIYLMQRTLKDLVNGIATKSGVEPSKILRTLRISPKGLTVVVDDDTVVQLPEGQDMIAEFHESKPQSPAKREWDAGPTDIQVDGDLDVVQNVQSEGLELRLLF